MPVWIHAPVWFSGRDIQRETIKVMPDAGSADGYCKLHTDDKGYTFPVWDPHLRLDYVFTPARFANHLAARRVINIFRKSHTLQITSRSWRRWISTENISMTNEEQRDSLGMKMVVNAERANKWAGRSRNRGCCFNGKPHVRKLKPSGS